LRRHCRPGVKTLPGTAVLYRQTVDLSKALDQFGSDSIVKAGLSRLTQATGSLKKPLQFLAPVQSTCNYATLFLRNPRVRCPTTLAPARCCASCWVAIDNDIVRR